MRISDWSSDVCSSDLFAVNFLMASLATSTFSGVVVENSYVASQHFNRWLDEAAQEKALGWKVDVQRRTDGRLALALTGVPRSEERRAGKECVSPDRSRWSTYNRKKKKQTKQKN